MIRSTRRMLMPGGNRAPHTHTHTHTQSSHGDWSSQTTRSTLIYTNFITIHTHREREERRREEEKRGEKREEGERERRGEERGGEEKRGEERRGEELDDIVIM